MKFAKKKIVNCNSFRNELSTERKYLISPVITKIEIAILSLLKKTAIIPVRCIYVCNIANMINQ